VRNPPNSCFNVAIAPCMRRRKSEMSNSAFILEPFGP
jgi:hypothetical protein